MSTNNKCYSHETTNHSTPMLAQAIKIAFLGGRLNPSIKPGVLFGTLQEAGWGHVLKSIGDDRDINALHDELVAEGKKLSADKGIESKEYIDFVTAAPDKLALRIVKRFGGFHGMQQNKARCQRAVNKELEKMMLEDLEGGNADRMADVIESLTERFGGKVVKVDGEKAFADMLGAIFGEAPVETGGSKAPN